MRNVKGKSLILIGFLLITAFASANAQIASDSDKNHEIETRARDHSVDQQQLDYYLIQALLAPLPEQRLALNHVGMQLRRVKQDYVVSSVLDGYPAHLAGIRRADKILRVDGQDFHPVQSFNNAGPPFQTNLSSIEIEYQRGEQILNTAITPVFENLYDAYRNASSNSILTFNSGNKIIGYVHLWTLSRSTNDMLAFAQIMSRLANCDGIILDLRDSFGFIDNQHLDQFFPNRRDYYTSYRDAGSEHGSPAVSPSNHQNKGYFARPVVVLQDQGTRGEMEMFASQLAQLQRVVTLGEQTSGLTGQYQLSASSDIIYQPAPNPVDESRKSVQYLSESGNTPKTRQNYSLTIPQLNDPQFEAALMTLMSIM